MLKPISGEFRDERRERAFLERRLPETLRHARLLVTLGLGINLLMILTDRRFAGQDFYPMLSAGRLLLVAASAMALWRVSRSRCFAQVEVVLVGWQVVMAITAAGMVALTRSQVATLAAFFLPVVYHLGVPTRFRFNAPLGVGCSLAMIAALLGPGALTANSAGVALMLLTTSLVCVLVTRRTNRLLRLEHAARAEVEQLFQAAPMPMALTRPDGRLILANEVAYRHLGYRPEDLVDRSVADLYVHPEERSRLVEAVRASGRARNVEITLRTAEGGSRLMLASASRVEHDGVECLLTGLVDITERKRHEDELRRFADTDPLTALRNRRSFHLAFDAEVARALRHDQPLSVLLIDLDHFKQVNDTHGHDAGDAVLRAFARLCRDTMREQDVVARLGGEEFAILLSNSNAAGAQQVATRLCRQVEALAVPSAAAPIRVTASIGIAEVIPGDADTALAQADAALYRAKRQGRNQVCLAAQTTQ